MVRGAVQKIRILYLMRILLENTDDVHGLTLLEITKALTGYGMDVERKALYDDLEVLRVFGLDIEKRKGKSVTYHVVSREFEEPELKLLLDAVQSSRFITYKKSVELIKKLSGLVSRHQAMRLSRQVFVSNRIKNMNESIYYTIDSIYEAISEDSKICFSYFDWTPHKRKKLRHDGKVYTVSPWTLTWDHEKYYLIAYDSEDAIIKHYRVDKMVNISICGEKRDGSDTMKNFDIAMYSRMTFSMYSGREELVTLRCHSSLAAVIIDRFGISVPFTDISDDGFTVTVKVAVSPVFLTWVMNFGKDMVILAPDSVRDEFVNLAREALSRYEK